MLEQITSRISSATPKQKIAVGVSAFTLIVLCSCSCVGITWQIGVSVGEGRAKAAKAAEKAAEEKAIDDAAKRFAKVFPVPASMKREKAKDSDFLTPDKAAMVDGIKVELVEGSVGKIKYGDSISRNVTYTSKKEFFQLRVRVTNTRENMILNYLPWHDHGFSSRSPALEDEFGNRYDSAGHGRNIAGGTKYEDCRVLPGKSIEDLIPFEMPLPAAKEFRLELDGAAIKNFDAVIAFKIPRSFFERENP